MSSYRAGQVLGAIHGTLPSLACLSGCAPAGYPEAGQLTPETALADACAAVGWVLNADPCRAVPSVRQANKGYPSVGIWEGKPRLTYDRENSAGIIRDYGYGTMVAVFGHELGHVVYLLEGGDPDAVTLENEPRADAWAGCAARITGHPVAGVKRLLGDYYVDDPEIAKARQAAVQEGWELCAGPSPL